MHTNTDRLRRWSPYILLTLLVVTFLYPVLLGGKALLPAGFLSGMRPWNSVVSSSGTYQWNPLLWDGIAQFYPWRTYYCQSMNSGQIPLWNSHQFCGTPFAANAQTAVFYPLTLLFALIAPVRAFGYSAALHLLMAAIFTFMLMRAMGVGRLGSIISGVVFAFSGFMVVWLELPTLIDVAAWLPLALLLILRASNRISWIYALFAGVALGLSILAGHFQIASYVMAAAVLWWLWLVVSKARTEGITDQWKRVLLAVTCFALAFLIAAPQVLPTLELAGRSHRVRAVSAEGYTSYVGNSIPTSHLITLFVPNFYGNPSTKEGAWAETADLYMERALYCGLLPLVLALIGAIFVFRRRNVTFFTVLGLLSLLFAFGSPLNFITYHIVPGSSSLGGPNRCIVLFCFSVAVLAGFGVQWFADKSQQNYAATGRKLGWRALVVSMAALGLVLISSQFIATAYVKDVLQVDPGKVMTVNAFQYLSFGSIMLAGLAVLAMYTIGYLPRPIFGALVLLVTAADLFSFGGGFNPVASPKDVYPNTNLTTWIKDNVGDTRLMPINSRWSLTRNPGAILPPNAATVYGFYDMQGYDSLFAKSYKDFMDSHLGEDSSPMENGNMVFVKKYVTSWPKGTAGYVLSSQPKGTSQDSINVYKITGYQPAYFLPKNDKQADSEIVDRNTNEIIVNAATSRSSKLVLAETNYPGWQANIDGMNAPVQTADEVFQSVTVPAGTSTVKFSFLPGTFVVGAFLGLLGALIVGLGVGFTVARNDRG